MRLKDEESEEECESRIDLFHYIIKEQQRLSFALNLQGSPKLSCFLPHDSYSDDVLPGISRMHDIQTDEVSICCSAIALTSSYLSRRSSFTSSSYCFLPPSYSFSSFSSRQLPSPISVANEPDAHKYKAGNRVEGDFKGKGVWCPGFISCDRYCTVRA